MVDLHKQIKPRRRATIIHYAPRASLSTVDSVRHNCACILCVNPRELLVYLDNNGFAYSNYKFTIRRYSKVHNIHTKLNRAMSVTICKI